MKSITTRLSLWAIAVSIVLMIPFISKAPWTTRDFVFAGAVLFGLATAYELITRNMSNKTHRMAVGAAGILILMTIWAWAVA